MSHLLQFADRISSHIRMNAVEREKRGKVRSEKTGERAGCTLHLLFSVAGIMEEGQGLNSVFT